MTEREREGERERERERNCVHVVMMMKKVVLAMACAVAVMVVALSHVSYAIDIPSDLETSTVTGLRPFGRISNVSTKASSSGCTSVSQLAVTIKQGAGYSVTMTPPNYVEPVVQVFTLRFNLNPEYENYKGKAGVVVTMPGDKLEDIIAVDSSVFHVLPGVAEDDGGFDVDASTSAKVFIAELEDDEIDITASTSSMVVVTTSSRNDDLDANICQVDTSAMVHIVGAHEVEIGEARTSASIMLVGNNLESVDIDDIKTSATVFAEFNNDDDDTEMTIDNIDTGANVTIRNCDDLEVEDASTGAVIDTDNSRNCDQVREFTGGSSPDLICTVDSGITAPETPDFPTSAVIDVDLSQTTCGLSVPSGSTISLENDGNTIIDFNFDD